MVKKSDAPAKSAAAKSEKHVRAEVHTTVHVIVHEPQVVFEDAPAPADKPDKGEDH